MAMRALRRSVFVVVMTALLFGAAWVLPTAAAAPTGGLSYDTASNTYTVLATGGDDTDMVQAAFDGCGNSEGCTVQLGAGTFHTGMIVVNDFQGAFRGMGDRVTTVEALPDYPSPSALPFWTAPPGDENPWPVMFIFFDGDIAIADLPISVPWHEPSLGWQIPGLDLTITALNAAVIISGEHANAVLDHVMVRGAEGTWAGTNLLNGVYYEGILLKPGWTNPFTDFIMLSGLFVIRDSGFYRSDCPFCAQNLVDAQVIARDNSFDTAEYPIALFDVSNTVVELAGSRMENVFGAAGILAWQGYAIPDLVPSQLLIADNEMHVGNGATGVLLMDFATVPSLDAIVVGNEIATDATSPGGIVSNSLRSTVVAKNDVRGGALDGIILIHSTGVVEKNEVLDSGQWGIALVSETSDTIVMKNEVRGSGLFDLYWDGTGTGNTWVKNEFGTADPADLG